MVRKGAMSYSGGHGLCYIDNRSLIPTQHDDSLAK